MIILLLAAFGFAFIVGHSKISLPFRIWLGGNTPSPVPVVLKPAPKVPLDDSEVTQVVYVDRLKAVKPVPFVGTFLIALIECPGCLGFWIGVAAEWYRPSLDAPRFLAILTMGCVVAASNFILSRITRIDE